MQIPLITRKTNKWAIDQIILGLSLEAEIATEAVVLWEHHEKTKNLLEKYNSVGNVKEERKTKYKIDLLDKRRNTRDFSRTDQGLLMIGHFGGPSCIRLVYLDST